MSRYNFVSRVQVWVLAGLLCLVMATAVLSISTTSHSRIADAATSTPTPTSAPNGWTDPIGG